MSAGISDHELLKGISSGDRLAFQTLYARHNVKLFRYLMRLVGERALAEDVLHDVFLEVWRSAGRFEGRSSPATWMMSIARFRAVDSLRRRGAPAAEMDEAASEIADEDFSPEERSMMGNKSEAIRRCLEKLSPEHREIIDLVYYHEKSIREICEIVGIPENTVKTRMFYARKKLQSLLTEAGIDARWP